MNCEFKIFIWTFCLNNLRMDISKMRKRKKEDWISKDLKSKIPKLDNKTIYVPPLKELPF